MPPANLQCNRKSFKWRVPLGVVAILLAVAAFWELGRAVKLTTLEYEYILRYKLDVNPRTGVPERISGLAGSSYCVSDVTIKKKDSTLTILVTIGLCGYGRTGNFSVPIDVTDDIREVRFGTKENLLWSRPSVPVGALRTP